MELAHRSRRAGAWLLVLAACGAGTSVLAHENDAPAQETRRWALFQKMLDDALPAENAVALTATPCAAGSAAGYPCSNVDLMSFMPLSTIGGGSGSDLWGWTDSTSGRKYALMGRTNGTAFVDISDAANPVYLGNLPPHTVNSTWREIKVYADHAFIISEASGHGMQVFDLRQLRDVTAPPKTFSETAHYAGFSTAHDIIVNMETGFIYVAGSNTCSGGLHMLDVSIPTSPVFVGCVASDGYTHDAQCVVYRGPDVTYEGHEICFNSNEDTLTIVDVTNKSAPVQLSKTGYVGVGYTHQGWLTEDQQYFLLDDELDEQNLGHPTRTRVFDVRNLDGVHLAGMFDATTAAIDHNQFVVGNFDYQANYRAGLRVIEASRAPAGVLSQAGYFDIYPLNDSANFNAAWGTFPFYADGIVTVSGMEQGLFVLHPKIPEFAVDLGTEQPSACKPASASATVDVGAVNGYSGVVTLSAVGLPAGAGASFGVNPFAVPASVSLTVTVSGVAPGSYQFSISGADGTRVRQRSVGLHVADAVPGSAAPVSPVGGTTGVTRHPTFTWSAAPQARDYTLEVATDPGFAGVIYSTVTDQTSHALPGLLSGDTVHYWRIRASNACGPGPASATASFATGPAPAVLLVDDDDDAPDVRGAYAVALTALGQGYDVWSTSAAGEPDAATLAAYPIVVWATGDDNGGSAGPEAATEVGLGAWLDGSACLLLASQDYLLDRGLTPLAQGYLGAASFSGDVFQASIAGTGPVFGGLGPYPVSLPYANRTDALVPGPGAALAFSGSAGGAGLSKDGGYYRTAFLGTGLEGLPALGRPAVLGAFLDWCAALPAADGDGDGTPNGMDCTPSDPTVWSAPSPALDLRVGAGAVDNLAWSAPAQPGAAAVSYDVLRSDDPASFLTATCVESGDSDTLAGDGTIPAPGGLLAYLVRVRNACGGNLGYDSLGVPRTGAACP